MFPILKDKDKGKDDGDGDEPPDGGRLHLKFGDALMVDAFREGIAAGLIVHDEHFDVILVADDFEVRTRMFRLMTH